MSNDSFSKTISTPGYGQFPYIIVRVHHGIYMQIPIHFIKEEKVENLALFPGTHITNVSEDILKKDKATQISLLHDRLLEATKNVISKIKSKTNNDPQLCLVLGKNRAIYYENGKFKENSSIPQGGTLIDQNNKTLAINANHYIED